MLIGEIVKQTGLSRDTIRFYEKMRLITVPKNGRRQNNYKEYPDDVVGRLRVIQQLKQFGFTLNEIGELLDLYEAGFSICRENLPKVRLKIELIAEKIEELTALKNQLAAIVRSCPEDCKIEKTLGEVNRWLLPGSGEWGPHS
jgi:DNA-binding transcriptional MerR regulator